LRPIQAFPIPAEPIWEIAMSNSMRGVIAGFIATLVVSAVILLKVQFHIVPDELSIMSLLGRIAGGSVSAWADHFIIGTLVWGMLFGGFDALVPALPYWLKGAIFSVLAWLFMMIVFMPFAGVGFFGVKLGVLAAVVTLVQHLIYGVSLGVVYGLLSAWGRSKAPERSRQT
jgi:hypothetical protein